MIRNPEGPMIWNRHCCWIFLVAATWALLPRPTATAQPDKDSLPRLSDAALQEVVKRSGKDVRGIPAKELEDARSRFAEFAKYFANLISHPLVYRAAQQDPSLAVNSAGRALDKDKRQIPTIDEILGLLDYGRFLLEPNPLLRSTFDSSIPRVTTDHADYIRELGAAFDMVLRPLIDSHPDRAVRINAMRLYASVCRSGAAPLWTTVTELLTSENVPTEIKYYALQAAGNLLTAYDPYDYRSRRHRVSRDTQEPRSEADRAVGALVAAVEACVTDPNAMLTGPNALRDKKLENATPDQIDVIRFVRKQAIKALAQVRFMTLPGPDGKPVYPAMTLIKVCMSDPGLGYQPSLLPTPTPAECGEAVLGLMNMAPVSNGLPIKGFKADALVEAMTAGLITCVAPRVDPADRSQPWRGLALRLSEAMKNWRPLFDPIYDPAVPNTFNPNAVPAEVNDFISRVQATVIAPLERTDATGKPDPNAKVDPAPLVTYLRGLRDNPKRSGFLIVGVAQTALPGLAKP